VRQLFTSLQLTVVRTNHKRSPISIRENLSCANDLSKALLLRHNTSERDKQIMDRLTRLIINKLLHEPNTRIKEHVSKGDGESYEAVMREVFAMGQ
jgi:glutamyl-tRNA reductase